MPNVFGNSTKTDGCVGTDTRLLIIRSTRQELEKFSVNNSITEFINDRQDGLDGLLSDNRSHIGKARSLEIVRPYQNTIRKMQTDHWREDLVGDDLLGEIVNHQRKIVQKTHAQCTVWIPK